MQVGPVPVKLKVHQRTVTAALMERASCCAYFAGLAVWHAMQTFPLRDGFSTINNSNAAPSGHAVLAGTGMQATEDRQLAGQGMGGGYRDAAHDLEPQPDEATGAVGCP
jgi:hypothetical protein